MGEREFGPEHAVEIANIVEAYAKYNGRRKPELLEPSTYSLINYNESESVQVDYQRIADQAEQLYKTMPAEKKDAFFQLVLYPVKACAVVNEMYIAVAKNRMYAVQGRASTNDMAEKALRLFHADEELSRYYNQSMANGKWDHMMDQTHIGYTFWNQPIRNAMPAIQEIQVPKQGEIGVAVEGSIASWPDGQGAPTLPSMNVYDQRPRYFEVFNRGQEPFTFTVEASEPWLHLSSTGGTVTSDQRILVSVDWNAIPANAKSGSITVTGPKNRKITLTVSIANVVGPNRSEIEGFIETDGYVSMEAEHFSRAVDSETAHWMRIPDFGRTLSAMTTYPVMTHSQSLSPTSAHLEYQMYLFKEGTVSVDVYLAPTQKFQPGSGFRFGISFDDETPQIINVHAVDTQAEWERSVKDSIRILTSKHVIARSGYHTLKYWIVDPGLVLEKLVVDTGGVKPSYLGPPESFHQTRSNDHAK